MALDLTKEFKVNDLAEDGKWFDLGDGAEILLRSVDSGAYQKALNYERNKIRNTNNDKQMERAMVSSMAKAIVLGWKGFEYEGKEFVYSKENAKKILSEMKPFRDQVMKMAGSLSSFMEDDELD